MTWLYDDYGIYTMVNPLVGRYGATIDVRFIPETNDADERTREVLIEQTLSSMARYKDTRGIIRIMRPQLNGDGFLIITARRESFEEQAWTSARLITQDRYEFADGRVEARSLLPEGRGLWPAFWMLGADFPETTWPVCGEIDIMENFARSTTEVAGTIHGPADSAGAAFGGKYTVPEGEDITVFTPTRIEWDPDHIAWYVDDVLYHTAHPCDVEGPWVLNDPFFMLLNLAVGGNPVPNPDETTPDENEMVVDWVRVYERRQPLDDPSAEDP